MKDQIQTILLGVIALCLVVQVILKLTEPTSSNPTFSITNPTTSTTPPSIQSQGSPGSQYQLPNQPGATNQPGGSIESEFVPTRNPTTAQWSETTFDIGELEDGEKKRHTFEVTNSGTNPLFLDKVKGDPGLEIISSPPGPLAPGEKGKIEVEFSNEGVLGFQTKQVHIDANIQPAHSHLQIQATVN